MPEKDPFGDKLKDKERGEEEQYFAKRESALLDKMRRRDEARPEASTLGTDRRRCAKCGGLFTTSHVDDTEETCPSCRIVRLGP